MRSLRCGQKLLTFHPPASLEGVAVIGRIVFNKVLKSGAARVALRTACATSHETLRGCRGGVDFGQTSAAGKGAWTACPSSSWSVGLHARPADKFVRNTLERTGMRSLVRPLRLCQGCSSLEVPPNADFCIRCSFSSWTKQRACARGSKKSGVRHKFWNDGDEQVQNCLVGVPSLSAHGILKRSQLDVPSETFRQKGKDATGRIEGRAQMFLDIIVEQIGRVAHAIKNLAQRI